MIRVVILGGGNVALHLLEALVKSPDCTVVQVYNRSMEKIAYLAKVVSVTDTIKQLAEADIYILAVSDDAINTVSKKISSVKGIIAHTSGSTPIKVLPKNGRRASFYPLQTFTTGRNIDFKSIPICLEAEQKEDLEVLRRMATSISDKVYAISSGQRQALHLSAVFVNNFTNHLYQIGAELCLENGLSFDLLRPLILETAHKIEAFEPLEAQTGPARRGDSFTLERHVLQLHHKNHKEIYQLLSASIKNTHGKKL